MHKPNPNNQPPPELTSEDYRRIQKSMRRPQFMGLLSEYMVEISDPKNKTEYDEYLKQMEREGELPKYMELIQPKAEFCIKTKLIANANRSQDMKFFINICSSPEMEKPSFDSVTDEKGEPRQNWRIPHSMGKIRYDQDSKGNVCNTVDAVFHPDVFMFCARNPMFEKMIVDIALDASQRQLGERKETLSKDYIRLNRKVKGDTPALLPIRKVQGKLMNRGEGGEVEERSREGAETKLQKDINEKKRAHEEQKKIEDAKKEQEDREAKELQNELSQKPNDYDPSKGPEVPKFKTIYTYPVDYSDFIETKVQSRKKRPSAFNVQFSIPRVQGFSEVKLDIGEEKIVLSVEGKYFIDLEFKSLKNPYKLDIGNAKAKFDKKKKGLRVVIPIDQSSIVDEQFPRQLDDVPVENDNKQAKGAATTEDNKTDQKKESIIENKTWQDKSKLLELCDTTVSSLQIVQKPEEGEANEKKPLVQELDEDDEIEGAKKVAEATVKKPVEQAPAAGEKILSYKFQEVKDKAFIILHLPKYKKEEVQVLLEGNQILVDWSKQNNLTEYAHLRVQNEFDSAATKLSFVVDYVVVNLTKKDNAFWEAKTVKSLDNYKQFKQKFAEIAEIRRKEEEERLKEQERLRKQQEDRKQAEKEKQLAIQAQQTQTVSETKPDAPGTQTQGEERQVKQVKEESAVEHFKTVAKTKNLQFLKFNISLAMELD